MIISSRKRVITFLKQRINKHRIYTKLFYKIQYAVFAIIAHKEVVYTINIYHKCYFMVLLSDPIFNERIYNYCWATPLGSII